mgnify:CR=1 FL=1
MIASIADSMIDMSRDSWLPSASGETGFPDAECGFWPVVPVEVVAEGSDSRMLDMSRSHKVRPRAGPGVDHSSMDRGILPHFIAR